MADENDPDGPEDDLPPEPPSNGEPPNGDVAAEDGAQASAHDPSPIEQADRTPADAEPEVELFDQSDAAPSGPDHEPEAFAEAKTADEIAQSLEISEQALVPPLDSHDAPPIESEPAAGIFDEPASASVESEPTPDIFEEPVAAAVDHGSTPDVHATDQPSDPEASAPDDLAAARVFEKPIASAVEDAATEQVHAADQSADPETTASEEAPEPAPTPAALPNNYFRAAGDPEEPPEDEPKTSLQRAQASLAAFAATARAYLEPRWVRVAGATRAVLGNAWRHIRGIKHPRSVREAAVWSGWAAGGFVALLVGFFVFVTWGMPSTDDLWEARNAQSITFLDRNGHVILREGAQNAPPVDLDSLPPYVTQAFIAIEDRRFYDHFGVDVGGMMRAGAENLRAGRVVQGGSTITQQLAKNLFLTNERSWRRKAQEIAMAIWLEGRFTKDEILALYLSRVYFGAGAYGVEAAAERYFDRPARELTLLQSAMIAGLAKAPSRLNPARQDIAAARDRATVVLNEMVGMGFISVAERDAALREELVISRRNPAGVLSYYRDWIDPLLNQVIGQQRDDFIVETTIDIATQRAASEAVDGVLAEQGEARRVSQGAAIVMDDEGGVRALVGGRDYDQSQFNRATQARRQPGSSFKFFIYLAAMENGLTPWSVREDAPITVYIDGQDPWTPGNYTNEFHGSTELTRAFAQSFNMVAIRVANEVGGQNVIDVARRLGVRSPLHNYHSLALGAQEITLLEMTQAYGAMAAEGTNIEAHGVARIRRANSNETLWSFQQENRQQVIEERPLRYMNYMMRRVVDAGTGTAARMQGRQVGGKTGTGNDYRDAWFIGFVPGMVGGVWVGNDNFAETARVTGGSLPTEIWARIMPTALRNTPVRDLQLPGAGDYDTGVPAANTPELTAVGAPIGAVIGGPQQAPPDTQDRSLDFGPEG